MAGYPPGSGYPYGGGYPTYPGAPPSAPYGEKPPKEGKSHGDAAPAGYYQYGAPQPYAPGGPYGSPAPYGEKPPKEGKYGGGGDQYQYGTAPPAQYGEKPPKEGKYGGGGDHYQYGTAPPAPYGEKPPKEGKHGGGGDYYQYGGHQPAAAGAPYGTMSPFAALVPSQFPPGTDPNVVACFQAADRDGSGLIDDKELQQALSSYNQSFSLRTVHLLMYLFTGTNVRRIGPKEFTSVFFSLQNWRAIFERFDRDRSGKIDTSELREALMSLGYAVSPSVLDLLVSKFDKSGGKNKAIEYDNFIECCLTVKGLTDKFKEKDTMFSGSATFTYESFMLTVLPFLIA
ncbi:calcium-binding protein CBP-like [Typha angustifolia]|uniref:calcium-binding protein CBP-like n=1 Tax=Typha angustifolia TaxID=59011 RepID=UPI003C2C2A18